MNPSGFLFGPNATLNVGGMVAFTTADYLRFQGSQTLFNNASTPDSLGPLSIVPVAAFGFLGSNPAAIAVQGSTLSVASGQSLSLVGGNQGFMYTDPDTGNQAPAPVPGGVTMTGGKLLAPGGQINIASVASPGEIQTGTLNFAPNVNGQSFGALGSINISQRSVIDGSGNGGGTVLIRGGNFILDNSTISANVTGPGPVIDGGESIGHGIDIQVSQNATVRNGAFLETNILANVTPGVTYGGIHMTADHIEIAGPAPIALPFGQGGTGIRSDVQPTNLGANGGNISLDANSITVKGGATLESVVNGSPLAPPPGVTRTSKAGDISLTANQDIQINGSTFRTILNFDSGSAANIAPTSRHGNILESGNAFPPGFTIKPGDPIPPPPVLNIIFDQTFKSTGKPGNITFNAPEGDIQLAGAITNIIVQPPSAGAPPTSGVGGQLSVNAHNLSLINNSSISVDNSSPQPDGNFTVLLTGNLTLNSSRIVTTARGPARAAEMDITAHNVLVTNGALLSTQTANTGPGGPLNIHADTVQLTNGGHITSGSHLDVDPFTGQPLTTSGAGGTINIQGLNSPATSVLVDGANSGIITSTSGTGAAGNTNITSQSLTIQNGGTISAATSGTASSAVGGSITVNATNGVAINSGGSITASSTGPANAGNIVINAGPQLVLQNGSITTQASQAGGGNIQIKAGNLVQLNNSSVSTSVLGGGGSGGNISIDPNTVLLQNSQILANAVQGTGGNISITTNLLLADANSNISASSQFGQNGTITIQSPISQAGGKIQPLGKSPLLATSLLNQRCAALAGGEFSSFTLAGRDSLPAEPGSWISNPLALAALSADTRAKVREEGERRLSRLSGQSSLSGSARTGIPSDQIDETDQTDQRNQTLLSLRQIAPPGFLTQSFAVDVSSGCAS
jgi:large exoprotein involved in heme utilization and adhesion